MLIGILFILLSILLGFLVVVNFKFANNLIKIISISIPVGFILSGWIVFIMSYIFGSLSILSILASEIIILIIAFLYLSINKKILKKINKIDSGINKKIIFSLLIFIVLSSYFFFGFRYDKAGNLLCYNGFCSDGPWHISIINSFVNKNKFLPDFPLFFNARMTYPFMSDFLVSILVSDGFNIFFAIKLLDILLIFSIVFITFYFIYDITKSSFIANTSLLIFFFYKTCIDNYLLKIIFPKIFSRNNLLDFQYFNFTNVINNIFHPQRSYLIGFPIAIFSLWALYYIIKSKKHSYKEVFYLGAIIGLLPLFHAHSFIAINIFMILLLLVRKYDEYIIYLSSVLFFSFPQVFYILTQPKSVNFFEIIFNASFWNILGNNSIFMNKIAFWFACFGIILITGLVGIILNKRKIINILFIPVVFSFILINIVKFQPSFGDSNKITIYFLLFLSIYSSIFIKKLIKLKFKIIAILIIFILSFGFLNVLYHDWYKINTMNYEENRYNENYPILYHRCDFLLADAIKNNTRNNSVILTYYSNSFVNPLTLTNRQEFMNIKRYLDNIGT